MFHRTNGNGGLYARLIELDFSWFSDDKQPDKISRFVSHNYGTAWSPLICYLHSVTDAELCEKYDKAITEIRKAIALQSGFEEETWESKKFTGIQSRIIKKLSILLLSVDIMLTAWDMSIDRSTLMGHILSVYQHNASRVDKIEEFYEAFIQHIARHRNEFPQVCHAGLDISSQIKAKGFQDRLKGRNCVWVLEAVFEDQLLKHGLDASPNVLHELHRRNMIGYFGD